MTESLSSATMDSPVGRLTLVADAEALVAVLWPSDDDTRVRLDHRDVAIDGHCVLSSAKKQLDEYFDRTRSNFDIPLAPRGTDFQIKVWAALRTIPYGVTWSYGDLADAIGQPSAARAVGAANGRNPLSIVVPCHRVVGKDGSLTGFAGGVDIKARLLDLEQQRH